MQKLLFAEKVLKQYHFKEKTGKLTKFSASHAGLDWKVDAVYSKLLAAAFYPSFQKKLTYMPSRTFRVSFSVEMDTASAVFHQKQSFWLFECPCKTRQNSNVHWLKVFEIPPIMAFRANSAIAQWKSHVMNIMDCWSRVALFFESISNVRENPTSQFRMSGEISTCISAANLWLVC